MQFQLQIESPTAPRKKHLFTISSLNKTTLDNNKVKTNRTLDYTQRHSVESKINNSIIENQLINTKIINVELNNDLFISLGKRNLNNKSINRIINSSPQKNKTRYKEGHHEIYRKGKGGIKVIAKYKHPLSDQRTPMKRYIKIQKIQLPNFDFNSRSSAIKMNAMTNNNEISDNMKKTIQQYSKYIERRRQVEDKSLISKSKVHKRNNSSIINHPKCLQLSNQQPLSPEKVQKKFHYLQDFIVRRPLGRKDYFVFGMTDRNTPENKVQFYRDFLWKVNFSNALHVQTPEQIVNPYRAYIGPGNNYFLVKSVLKRRFWWTIIQKPQNPQSYQTLNFLWTQLKQNNFFNYQQKSSYEILEEQKFQLMRLKKSQSATTEQPSSIIVPQDLHKKVFSKTDLVNWNRHLIRNQKTEQKINEHTYVKRMPLFHNKKIINIQNSCKLKVHNHLQCNFFIGNKKALFYNLRHYLRLQKVDPFTIVPLTFHISKGIQDPQFKIFKKYYEEIEAKKGENGMRNIWIIKPGENTNRGNGITVAYSIDDILVRLKGREKNGDGKLRTFIIQKYIERPLLYCKRKFDIRHYMLITCINGIFKAYWYEQGYIRTSSSQFTTKYSKDPFVHLTNDAIQKNGQNYGKFQRGNKLSYQDFQKYLQLTYKNRKINFFQQILPQMKQMATQSVKATYGILDENRREHNFQLLGLDFMIDQDFKPWLIQVNTNPCLELSCSLLERIIPNLVDNVFRICIDPLFPPPECWQTGKKLYFGESPLSENKFQIIFDELDDGSQVQKLYNGSNKLDEKMGKIQQDDEEFEDNGEEDWQQKK